MANIIVVIDTKLSRTFETPQKARAYIRSLGLSITEGFDKDPHLNIWTYTGKKKPQAVNKSVSRTGPSGASKKGRGKKDRRAELDELMPMWGTIVAETERELHRPLKPVEMTDLIFDFGDWPKGPAPDYEMRRRRNKARRIAKWYCT